MRVILSILICFCVTDTFAQDSISIIVQDNASNQEIGQVTAYDTKGKVIGQTNDQGGLRVTKASFPFLLEKQGYASKYIYYEAGRKLITLQALGGILQTIKITGQLNVLDYLVFLLNKNARSFFMADTTLYYHFNYSLSFPEKDWKEYADGFIATKIAGSSLKPANAIVKGLLTGFNFVQFHYKADDTLFVKSHSYQVIKSFPLFQFYTANAFGSFYKIGLSFIEKRTNSSPYLWGYHQGMRGEKHFTLYEQNRKDTRLSAEIFFDSLEHLQTIILYRAILPLFRIGAIKVTDNFSQENGVNRCRTIYTFTQDSIGRVLATINHQSTYYKKHGANYTFQLTASLYHKVPKKECKIPVIYFKDNIPEPLYSKGFGIFKLQQAHYDMNKDNFIKATLNRFAKE